MSKITELLLTPRQAADNETVAVEAAASLGVKRSSVSCMRIVRRSIDARRRGDVRINLGVELWIDDEPAPAEETRFEYDDVSGNTEIVVVGSGPAGLFAALELIELGYKPIVLERGKEVSARKKDIAAVNRNEPVDTDSNYAFGEGGAGTYSDGKLFTRSKKRGDNRKALEVFRFHGADPDILYDAHPHIGSDRLPGIIKAMRETVEKAGGRVLFGTKVTGFTVENGRTTGVTDQRGNMIEAAAVVLATGHSARDIYETLHGSGILVEAKPFAAGVRVEHPQELIDRIQYKTGQRDEYLPPASYTLAVQSGGRGVYTFCMCPGGFIVPALTAPGECVVNGMSPAGRNNAYANSGVVTQIKEEDFADLVPHFGPLAGLKFQQQLEMMGFAQAGPAQIAPAQRLDQFVTGSVASDILPTSYHPGLSPSLMNKWLPRFISKTLRDGIRQFDNKMKGYITDRAQVIGIESRTSSPVRIPRDRESLMHPQVEGLFPAGEGAGYAGGIISSAVDGIQAAKAVARYLDKQ